jgi:hypothetical protein
MLTGGHACSLRKSRSDGFAFEHGRKPLGVEPLAFVRSAHASRHHRFCGGPFIMMNQAHAAHERGSRFGGGVLDKQRHVCAFFRSREERASIVSQFTREAFERGEKASHIVDGRARQRRELESAGIHVAEAERSAQLELHSWRDVSLPRGRFDQARMVSMITRLLDIGRAQGFPRTCLVADIESTPEQRPRKDEIVEFETQLQRRLAGYPDAVICTYDASNFDASVMLDLMRTYAFVIVGGVVHENPFLVWAPSMHG